MVSHWSQRSRARPSDGLFTLQAERRAYREAEISMMDDISEGDSHKEDEPASPAPPPSQQHTDPASPTVAVTPEPVVRGEQATPSEIEYQVKAARRDFSKTV